MDQQLREIQQLAQAAGLPVFPGFPDGCATARWPDEDPAPFIDLAVRVHAPLLYLVGLTARDMAPADRIDLDDHPQVGPDQLVTIVTGWTAGTVLHTFTATDPSWITLADQAATDADIARFRTQLEAHELDELVEAAARDVVTDRAFFDHGSQGRDALKLAAIERLRPDLDEDVKWRVLRRANHIDRTENQPAREARWADHARQSMADGATKRAAATDLGISVNVLDRILQTNPSR